MATSDHDENPVQMGEKFIWTDKITYDFVVWRCNHDELFRTTIWQDDKYQLFIDEHNLPIEVKQAKKKWHNTLCRVREVIKRNDFKMMQKWNFFPVISKFLYPGEPFHWNEANSSELTQAKKTKEKRKTLALDPKIPREIFMWSDKLTTQLIEWRFKNDALIDSNPEFAMRKKFEVFVKEYDLPITGQQALKKWNDIVHKWRNCNQYEGERKWKFYPMVNEILRDKMQQNENALLHTNYQMAEETLFTLSQNDTAVDIDSTNFKYEKDEYFEPADIEFVTPDDCLDGDHQSPIGFSSRAKRRRLDSPENTADDVTDSSEPTSIEKLIASNRECTSQIVSEMKRGNEILERGVLAFEAYLAELRLRRD